MIDIWRRLAAPLMAIGLTAPLLQAEVVVTTLPAGMLQRPGQATATDRFVVSNNGPAAAAVSLTTQGSFFSISPASLLLPSGGRAVIAIAANPVPAGPLRGSVIVTTPGQAPFAVPVKLLAADPPAQRVALVPAESRVLVDRPPPVISPPPPPPTVFLSFTNPSALPVTALVTSDAAWLVPFQDSIVLAPGGTTSVEVIIDPSRRPDGRDPAGSLAGSVSLLFFSGPQTAATLPVTQLSTVVIDINRARVVSGEPSPVGLSEVAFFVGRYGGGVDLSLFARSEALDIRDLRLFYERAGVSHFPQLPANTGLSFVDLAGQAGSVQIRTPDSAVLNLAAIKTTITNGRVYASVLPILVSNQGALPGGQIYLPGVAKDATVRTDLYLQEVSGRPATVRIDVLDRNGRALAENTRPLEGFASAYLQDAVPPGAFTALVSNDPASSGRVGAVGVVTDLATGDVWPIRDGGIGAAAPGEPLFVPVADGRPNAKSEVHVINRGADVAVVQMETVRAVEPRRRAVDRVPGGGAMVSVPLAPNAGTTFSVSSTGAGAYARVSSAGGRLAASSRTAGPAGSGGSFGSALPVIAEPAVLRAGMSRSFAGIEDAAPATVAAGTPLTFRSELMLVETARADATVRLTLHYTISTGLAWTRQTSVREVVVRAGAFLTLRPIAGAIIGAERDLLGDLRNLVLTVDVVSGAGAVIPVVSTIENESGDITVRGQ